MSTSPSTPFAGDYPESRFIMDGWRVERPLRRRPVQRHYPGGVDHDQSQHAGSRARGPTDPAPPRTVGPGDGRIETKPGYQPSVEELAKAEKWFADRGFTREQIAANIGKYAGEGVTRHDDWYPEARGVADGLGKAHGVHRDRAAAVIAAVSPNNPWKDDWPGPGKGEGWSGNQNVADRLMRTYTENRPFTVRSGDVEALIQKRLRDRSDTERITEAEAEHYRQDMAQWVDRPIRPHEAPAHVLGWYHPDNHYLQPNAEKAYRILKGEDPNDVLSGQKVRSFYDNVARGGEGDSVTLDTHAVNLMFGGRITYETAVAPARPGQYEYLAQIHREVAAPGQTPSDVQATAWNNYRDDKKARAEAEAVAADLKEGRQRARAEKKAVTAIAAWAAGSKKAGSAPRPLRRQFAIPPIGDPENPDALTREQYRESMYEYYLAQPAPSARARRAFRVLRHYPGGQSHDQSTHAGKGPKRGGINRADAIAKGRELVQRHGIVFEDLTLMNPPAPKWAVDGLYEGLGRAAHVLPDELFANIEKVAVVEEFYSGSVAATNFQYPDRVGWDKAKKVEIRYNIVEGHPDNIKKLNNDHWFVPKTPAQAVAHEIGHVLDLELGHRMALRGVPEAQTLRPGEDGVISADKANVFSMTIMPDAPSKPLSHYGRDQPYEDFAEVMTLITTQPRSVWSKSERASYVAEQVEREWGPRPESHPEAQGHLPGIEGPPTFGPGAINSYGLRTPPPGWVPPGDDDIDWIETPDEDVPVDEPAVERHLPGQHDQQTHGRGGGGGSSTSSAGEARYHDLDNPYGKGARSPYPGSAGDLARKRLLRAQNRLDAKRRRLEEEREQVNAEARKGWDESEAAYNKLNDLRATMNREFGFATPHIDMNTDPRLRTLYDGADDAGKQRIAELSQQSATLARQMRDAHDRSDVLAGRSLGIMDEIMANRALTREAASRILFGEPAYGRLNMEYSPNIPADRRVPYDIAGRWTARAAEPLLGADSPDVNVLTTGQTRSFYTESTRAVNMAFGTGDVTMAHELGHYVENRLPLPTRGRAQNFLNRRARGEEERMLNEVTGDMGYENHELTTPDEFVTPYVGKRYSSAASSEALSMGMQYMYDDPVGFAKRDPDHFTFTYNTIRAEPDGDDGYLLGQGP